MGACRQLTVPMTISRSAWRGVKRGSKAPNRSMSYGDIESDMYSIAQHAVANGYGKSENLRAHATALSTVVSMTLSSSSACSSLPGLMFRSCMRNSGCLLLYVYRLDSGVSTRPCIRLRSGRCATNTPRGVWRGGIEHHL